MSATIICMTEEEPSGLHPLDKRGFSVRLAFETDETDDAAARQAFMAFLDALHDGVLTFQAFTIVDGVVTPLASPVDQLSDPDPVVLTDFITWLDQCATAKVDALNTRGLAPQSFWSKSAQVDGEVSSAATLDAYSVLIGASSWNAPVPHKLGLSHVLRVDINTVGEVVFVPCFNGLAVPTGVYQVEKTDVLFTYGQGSADTCRTSRTHAVNPNGTLLDMDTGFVTVSQQDNDQVLHRALTRFEQRAGSLFTGFFAVGEVQWLPADPSASLSDEQLKLQQLRRLSWRAISTLASSLDTLLLALMMPTQCIIGMEAKIIDSRDGALLGPFLNLLIDKLTRLNPAVNKSRTELRKDVREGIRRLKLCEPPPQDRAAFVETLLYICRPTVVAGETPFAAPGSQLYRLLQGYVEQSAAKWNELAQDLPDGWSEQMLTTQLAPLHEYILSEQGFEATTIRLLRRATTTVIEAIGIAAQVNDLTVAYSQAVDAFEQLLNDGLNGAEAARQSVGSLICDTVTSRAVAIAQGSPTTVDHLKQSAEELVFWPWRLGMYGVSSDPAFSQPDPTSATRRLLDSLAFPLSKASEFFQLLPRDPASAIPVDMVLDTDAVTAITRAAEGMQKAVLLELFAPDTSRFCPDSAPAPLAIPVTVDPIIDDEDSPDDFTAAFSGMALIIRRAFGDGIKGNAWSYANLNEFRYPNKADHQDSSLLHTLSIQPLPTTINDGRRALFVHYNGLPFASSAFDSSLPGDQYDALNQAFFGTDYPENTSDVYQRLPALAYGAMYEVRAHVVGRSGSLPRELQQKDPAIPWLTHPTINFVGAPEVLQLPYSRRTAIGGTTIGDHSLPRRIGVIPQGLQPLATDYPRLGMHSANKLFVDLFRRNDGSGALEFDTTMDASMEVHLEDFRYSAPAGKVSTLSVQVFDSLTTTPKKIMNITLIDSVSSRKTLSIKYTHATQKFSVEFEGANDSFTHEKGLDSFWLRLQLTSNDAATSVSFADPSTGSGSTAGQAARSEHLLLLGAGDNKQWHAPFDQPATVSIQFPCVGYADFVRWVANPALRTKLFNGLNGNCAADEKGESISFEQQFLFLLEAANIERARNPELGKLLDSLVDPAVDSLRLDVITLDGLFCDPDEMGRRANLQPVTAVVPIPPLGQMLQGINDLQTWLEGGRIKEILTRLNNDWQRIITVTPLDPDSADSLAFDDPQNPRKLRVPAGVSVQLSARPRVDRAYFVGAPGALHERLQELAVGVDGAFSVFEGTTLVIENMVGPLLWAGKGVSPWDWLFDRKKWTEKAQEVIQYKPAEIARVYDLAAAFDKKLHWQWRQLGAVTVTTQRWRFLGRPIYSWINPKARDNSDTGCASRAIPSDIELLNEFEEDAFSNRDPRDAKSITVNLLPNSAPTTLQQVQWEKPSASFFRHRFTLHSRYAAALKSSASGQCDAWPADVIGKPQFWLRVAMLAQPSRIVLTRPQLRALIPLTQSPEEGAGHTPPLLAILQERPFEYGGLADRVISEIRTGIGFAASVLPGDSEQTVAPFDTRKELGPDPRLSYQAYSVENAQNALLSVEGPIGLTFENDAINAPAFANNAQVLNPVSLQDEKGTMVVRSLSVQEHFLSVAMRRYLHPDWVVGPVNRTPTQSLSFSRGCWIELPQAHGELTLDNGKDTVSVVTLEDVDRALYVSINSRVVDATVKVPKPLFLGQIPGFFKGNGWSTVLFNTPVEDRRASLSVFVIPPGKSTTRSGSGNSPMLLASIEWTLPEGFEPTDLSISSPAVVRDISASQTTAMHWARTNKNFTEVNVAGPKAYEPGTPWNAEHLTAVVTSGAKVSQLAFSATDGSKPAQAVWIRPGQSMQAYPSHAQRHLAVMFSETHSGLGRTLEKPIGLHMVQSKSQAFKLAALPVSGAGKVRIIEFETPAVIIGYAPIGSGVIPVHHQFGYFDFNTIGVDVQAGSQYQRTLSLHFRLIAGGSTREKISEINLLLSPESSRSTQEGKIKFKHSTQSELAVFGIDMDLDASGQIVSYSQWQVDVQGQLQNGPVAALVKPVPTTDIQGLVMKVDSATFSDNTNHEFWLEVSMLVSTKRSTNEIPQGFTGELDLDWFFGTDEVLSDAASKEDLLRSMHEAQARIISVSPPINIQK